MEVNWNAVGLVVGLLFYGMLAAKWMRKPLKTVWTDLKALPRAVRAMLAAMAIVATVEAQKSGNGGGTNEPPMNAPAPGAGLLHLGTLRPVLRSGGLDAPEPTVTAEEIAQGCRLACETNEPGHSYEMPTNAVYIGRLHMHGARSDFGRNLVDLGVVGGEQTGWTFPYGPDDATTSTFWWFMDGRLQDSPSSPAFAASAGLGDVLAMQGESRLWFLAEGERRTVTWERFFVGGDTNVCADAQIVLSGNGDFTVRSNDLVRVYRRIDPNDWDGDGLDNLVDQWPTTSDGDCYGTGMDWFNANCSGVLSAVPANGGGYDIVWNANANENAYYWLSFTPTHDRTRVTVVCDGASNLGDMVVIANSNQVCEVPLLMGARYRVRASWPVEDIFASDAGAVIDVGSGATPPPGLRLLGARGGGDCGPSDDFQVERPVEFGIDGGEGSGRLTSVPDIGAAIGSITGNCCSVECSASNYVWSCGGDCHCSGYSQWWQVTALWEGYAKCFSWEAQCGCQRVNETNTSAWVSISAPSVIMRGGYSHYVTGVYNPPGSSNEGVSMSLACTAGAEKITILSQGSGWMEIRGAAVSDGIGDVEFRLVSVIAGESYTNTASLTVACVTNLAMTSAFAGESANPPPFDGETACPFSITNSLAPDRHLVVPFHRVASLCDGVFSVTNFTVDMNLVLAPAGVGGSSLACEWEVVEAMPQMSGALLHTGGLSAQFVNPKQGGVFRFRARCDGSPWTEGNVVLPLSGAGVDAVFESDLAQIGAVMNGLVAKYDAKKRNDPLFGLKWFVGCGSGDYRGRVDNSVWRTVWRYNQVADANGRGAVATWYGVPVPMAKLSNFVCGYGCELLGVTEENQQEAQEIGTHNDVTGDMSWEGGQSLAGGGNAQESCSLLARQMWPVLPEKARRLWPNPSSADNHVVVPTTTVIDYNYYFRSPEMINRGRAEGLIQ